MNTPPPGPGVAPPSGYRTSTDGMSSAARTIHDAAEDSQEDVRELKPTKMTDREFGTKHVQWHADFAKAIDELGAGADAMCANLMGFASQISGAGADYAATDSRNAQTVNQSGR
ncbi:MAG TPA: hypothetical protein VGX25_18910 [Actinophytocola sp.]|uniref:hypothetical protein n=1 Tax=Actinophytocola sp. TaxID=1872138 RepID=UPI002DDCEDD3|nr:hypothetical protein [Actinophytocola sp.]HEV2781457.1 hypothetical protein [Actinophytocola sp.]